MGFRLDAGDREEVTRLIYVRAAALIEYGLNIRQFARDAHARKALQKIAAVGFCPNARIENGDHAAVGSTADQTADPLF